MASSTSNYRATEEKPTAVGTGLHPTLEGAAAAMRGQSETFAPAMTAEHRAARLERWDRAVAAIILAR